MECFTDGPALEVWVCREGAEAWKQAERHVPPNRQACRAQLRARLQQLAEKGRLRNPDIMNSEGEGIHAVKTTCGLRAYGWFTSGREGKKAFCIGHVVMKKQQKAIPQDLERARRMRDKYEE